MKLMNMTTSMVDSVYTSTADQGKKLAVGGWRIWIKLLISHVISGGSTAALSALALMGANASGIDVPVLNFKAIIIVFLFGGITGAFTYLKNSPLPGTNGE